MKNKLIIVLLSLFAGSMYGACCLGDGCPNVLGEYRDSAGNPTGKYALLDASGNPIPLKGGTSCSCSSADLTTWPPESANCPQCAVACPKCKHPIFQHTCDEKGNPGAGTKGLQ